MKRLKLLFLFLGLWTFSAQAQDTITVQAFNFESTTRDSLISFPEGDHNEYSKILMYYTMRCKDGLISTSSDRNKGCGEWDYSCNTSIIDSSVMDSVLATHPDYVIPGISDPFFLYTTQPVQTYYKRNIEKVNINSTSGEEEVVLGAGGQSSDALFSNQNVQKIYYLIDKSEVSGLNESTLGAIGIKDITGVEDLNFVKIEIGQTDSTALTNVAFKNIDFTTVFDGHVLSNDLNSGKIHFARDYNFDSGQNIVLSISYSTDNRDNNMTTSADAGVKSNFVYHDGNDRYLDLTNTTIEVPVDNLGSVSNEITIAYWVYGDADALPKNTTTIYGEDADGKRQVNIHHPWSNSKIVWDCGNDGGGYDRIEKSASFSLFKGKWNHWAFTKNVTTGKMTMYYNGNEWKSETGKNRPISIKTLVIGTDDRERNNYIGKMDDVMIFDKELGSEELKKLMTYRPQPGDSYYDNLKLFLDFNGNDTNNAQDHSNGAVVAHSDGALNRTTFRGDEIFKDFSTTDIHPTISLFSGNYNRNVVTEEVLDSVENFPNEIIPYRIENGDLVRDPSLYYWQAGETYIYDTEGEIESTIFVDAEDGISINTLEYYRDRIGKFELLSFVTPYGIGLDFGLDGKTWIFDVTDFGPILKGTKRLLMDRGGQWQEEMDIQFKFIKGTPARNVLSIQQVWPIDNVGYQRLLDNEAFERRTVDVESNVDAMKLRAAITGHGQEGEFIARNHRINLNGGATEFDWQVWTECAFNPVYPQGGTWVYDRAGWCPGAPTDLNEYDITDIVGNANSFDIDYGINTASGSSNYIVNIQLVKYGEPNFTNEAEIERIVSPTNYVEYERRNPSCNEPTIIVKNNGTETLTSLTITYGVDGTEPSTYNWTGEIEYLESKTIVLPSFKEGRWAKSNKFNVQISSPNGSTDENPDNNQMSSTYENTNYIAEDLIVMMFTNNAGNEAKWYLYDENDNVVASRSSGLSSNTLYIDTIKNLDGCYTLQVKDSGQDGLSWWANNDGNGYLRYRSSTTGIWDLLEPDFGGEISHSFTAGIITDVKEEEYDLNFDVNIFPNPSSGVFVTEISGSDVTRIDIYDSSGKRIDQRQGDFKNYHEEYFDISSHPDGMYFMTITNGSQVLTKKLIKGQ